MPVLSLTDFSPGIYSRPSRNHPNTVASPTNTYRCRATLNGALTPLATCEDISMSANDLIALDGGGLQSGTGNQHRIADVSVLSGVFNDDSDPGVDVSNTEVYLAIESWRVAPQTVSISLTDSASGDNLFIDKDGEGGGRLWADSGGDTYASTSGSLRVPVLDDGDPATNQGAVQVYWKGTPDRLVADLSSVNDSSDLWVRTVSAASQATVHNKPLDNSLANEWVQVHHDGSPASGGVVVKLNSNSLTASGSGVTIDTDDDVDELALSVWRYTHYEDTPDFQLLWAAQRANKEYPATTVPKRCSFVSSRSNNASPDDAGTPVIAWTFDGYAILWPSDTASTNNWGTLIDGSLGDADNNDAGLVLPTDMVGHQGRLLIFPLSLKSLGSVNSDPVVHTSNESFYWTSVNDLRTRDVLLSGFFNVVAFYENLNGYSVFASMDAGELFMVKAKGGGGMLRGDLNNFIAQSLRSVRSAGHTINPGTNSPLGFVYPVDGSGIWVWGGGDISTNLTPQLDPDFWRPSPVAPANGTPVATGWGYSTTGCASLGDYICLPNNYLLDASKGSDQPISAWRYEDPTLDGTGDAIIYHQESDWKSRWLFATPSGFTTSSHVALFIYDFSTPAPTYSWQSHPTAIGGYTDETGNARNVDIKEVVVEAVGAGTVTVTVSSGLDSTYTDSVTFDLDADLHDSDLPQMWRKVMVVSGLGSGVRGTHFTIRVQADSGGTDPAPDVLAVHFVYEDATEVNYAS